MRVCGCEVNAGPGCGPVRPSAARSGTGPPSRRRTARGRRAARRPAPPSRAAPGRVAARQVDDQREGDAPQALADDQAGRGERAHAQGQLRIGPPPGPAVVERADRGARHQRQDQLHRQVDPEGDGQRRQAQDIQAPESRVQADEAEAGDGAPGQHPPVGIAGQDAPGKRRDQPGLRCREGVRARPGRAREAEAGAEEVQHRRDDDGAVGHADDQGDLLLPGRRADELPGLEILQVVVGDGGDAEHDPGDRQGVGDQRPGALRIGPAAEQPQEKGRARQHGEDSDARQGRVRGADQPGHVAGHGGDAEADHEDEQQGAGDQREGLAFQRRPGQHGPQQPADRREQGQGDHHHCGDRQVALRDGERRAGRAGAPGRQRRADAAEYRSGDPNQGPDRRDAHHAGAEEAHVLAEHRADPGLQAGARHRLRGGQQRDEAAPGDRQPQGHRGPDRGPDEVADADQREGQVAGDPGGARADPEPRAGAVEDEPGLGQRREGRRDEAVPREEPQAAGAVGFPGSAAGAHRQHLGGGPALGKGQVGLDHEGAAQGHGEHHAEDPARRGDARGGEPRKALPPADHHQTGQHEDDRRQGAGRGSDGLDDVVLQDRGAGQAPQDRHGDDGGGNRGGEGQADLEAEIDVGGGEDQRDRAAEGDAAQRQFGGLGDAGHADRTRLRDRTSLGTGPEKRQPRPRSAAGIRSRAAGKAASRSRIPAAPRPGIAWLSVAVRRRCARRAEDFPRTRFDHRSTLVPSSGRCRAVLFSAL